MCQKYSASHCTFNSLLGVWKCGQAPHFVFDRLLNHSWCDNSRINLAIQDLEFQDLSIHDNINFCQFKIWIFNLWKFNTWSSKCGKFKIKKFKIWTDKYNILIINIFQKFKIWPAKINMENANIKSSRFGNSRFLLKNMEHSVPNIEIRRLPELN